MRKIKIPIIEIEWITIEDNIALWWGRKFNEGRVEFFYTDLNGKPLFDGETFQYTTAFSNSCACVKRFDEWYIIDISKMQLVSLSKDLTWSNINRFRNGNLALFDKK